MTFLTGHRVLERYPNNGKLLRCYGKFLEDARHDPVGAVRAYTEANRSGAGGTLLSLDLSSRLHGGGNGKPDFLTSMSVEEDAVVVIDAEGTIMMVSQVGCHGNNIWMMPRPQDMEGEEKSAHFLGSCVQPQCRFLCLALGYAHAPALHT